MRVRHLNLSNPQHSAAVQAPLATSAGGWGLCKGDNDQPVFGDTNDPDYQKMLAALKCVQRREEPGVKELLQKRQNQK